VELPTAGVITLVAPAMGRPAPVLRFTGPGGVPEGAFAANALPNDQLRPEHVPGPGSPWEDVEAFALTYDGYAYWSDVAELATRARQRWTRHGALPDGLDELRACLFYEGRRWHRLGGEPRGRATCYVADLLEAIGASVPEPLRVSAAS
jgi:hypothetical protein